MPKRRQQPTSGKERSDQGAGPMFDPNLAEHIQQFLTVTYEPRRPPIVSSRMLAFVIALNEGRPQPFPRREDAARLLHCSKDGLDAAISVALARNLLKIKMQT